MTRISVKGQLLGAKSTVGTRLRKLREACDLTQRQLAGRLGVDQTTVSRREDGVVPVTVDVVNETVAHLDRKYLGWVLTGAGEPPVAPQPDRSVDLTKPDAGRQGGGGHG